MTDDADVPGDKDAVPAAGAGTASGRARVRQMVALGTAVALVGAGAGTSVALAGGTKAGAVSPQQAVVQLLDAGANGDVLGALAALDPGERDAIEPGLAGLVAQLRRLGVLSGSASLSAVSGVSLAFHGVTMSTSYLGASLAEVRLTGGTVTTTTDVADFPLGSFVTGLAGSALHGQATTKTVPVSSGREGIATVEVGGRWYVSLGDTIAVDTLLSSGRSPIPPSRPVAPAGASSPDAEVTSFLHDLGSLDLRSVIADAPPDELGALQAYAPLFLPAAQAKLDPVASRLQLAITGESYTDTPLGDATLVRVSGATLTGTAGNVRITESHGCTTLSGPGGTKTTCAASERAAIEAKLPARLRAVFERLASATASAGIVVVQEGGRWYVSPTRTVLQDLDAVLGKLQPQDLRVVAAQWRQLLAGVLAAGMPATSTAGVP